MLTVSVTPSRTRKIRCDGAKPVCHNCGKRASGSTECNYDPLPKRRGPDKTPGARQRVARKTNEGTASRTRRRTTSSDAQDYAADNNGSQLPPFSFPSPSSSENAHSPEYIVSPHEGRIEPPYIGTCACHGLAHCPSSSGSGVLEHAVPGSQVGNNISSRLLVNMN